MKYDPSQLFSLEAIGHQDRSFYYLLSQLFADFKEGKRSSKETEQAIDAAVKKRFNINTKTSLDMDNPDDGAYAIPINLEGLNSLDSAYAHVWKEFSEYCCSKTRPIIKQITKGDLSPVGVMDYKKARVNGLFANLPPSPIHVLGGLINQYSPEEIASVYLHELGHHWTFFEFLGIYNCRNAVIANTIHEVLETKDEQERIAILVEESNYWNLEITSEELKDLVKLNDENLIKVWAGTHQRAFTHDKGFVQYDYNTSEVIADQFAARLGASVAQASSLSGMWSKRRNDKQSENRYAFISMGLAGLSAVSLIAISALSTPFVALTLTPVVLISAFMSKWFFEDGVDYVKAGNGWTYDNQRDRLKRIYNEVLSYLKNAKLPPDERKLVLTNLATLNEIINLVEEANNGIFAKLLRIFSSSYKNQEKKRLYQQMVEELLANQLYVTSAKFKTILGK